MASQTRSDQLIILDAYDTANSDHAHIYTRLEAASNLTPEQKAKLQQELLKRIPGDLDVTTLDAVNILAEIGDENAAGKLEELLNTSGNFDVPGKIGTAAILAIPQIRSREKN